MLDGAIWAGYNHTCVVDATGKASCWGDNAEGQLGDGTTATSNVPIAPMNLGTVAMMNAGATTTCATDPAGLLCFGHNAHGEFGDGTTMSSTTPVAGAAGLTNVVSVGTGTHHSCVALGDGSAWCFGVGTNGELGDGLNMSSTTPVMVTTAETVLQVSAGHDHACYRTSLDTVSCWGDNGTGELGNGTTAPSGVPVVVALTDVAEVEAGFSQTCARTNSGNVYCWGYNNSGQLGNGGVGMSSSTPLPVMSIASAVAIATGLNHVCAALADGTASCWGKNDSGQLGNGTTTGSAVPVGVADATNVVDVAAGVSHSCALLGDNSVTCWGDNSLGQLGTGDNTSSPVPVPVSAL